MNLELDFLSGLIKKTEEARIANIKLQEEKQKVIKQTVSTKQYCSIVGISPNTLSKRRDNGEIQFVMIGAEYRYFLPKAGRHNG